MVHRFFAVGDADEMLLRRRRGGWREVPVHIHPAGMAVAHRQFSPQAQKGVAEVQLQPGAGVGVGARPQGEDAVAVIVGGVEAVLGGGEEAPAQVAGGGQGAVVGEPHGTVSQRGIDSAQGGPVQLAHLAGDGRILQPGGEARRQGGAHGGARRQPQGEEEGDAWSGPVHLAYSSAAGPGFVAAGAHPCPLRRRTVHVRGDPCLVRPQCARTITG